MLATDQSGNKLLEFIKITEEDAALQFSPITVCLLVVKIGKDYLMGFNHWRKGWEIFGGCPEEGESLREAEVTVAKKLSVHLQLHGDPHDKAHPEVIYWRSRLETAVSKMDSEMKVYDFRLAKDENGVVKNLNFHLLIPHRYAETESCIHDALEEKMRVYQDDIGLEIRFVRSYV